MDRSIRDPWIAVIVGVGAVCGIALGVIIGLLVRDRKSSPGNQLSGGVHIWNMPNGGQLPPFPMLSAQQTQPPRAVQLEPTSRVELRPSDLRTFALSTTSISRVATASSKRHWRVEIRNMGPPGSIAFVSSDSNALSFPSMCLAIPAGGSNEVRLRPSDALFAISSIDGVSLSVAASEELA